MSTGIATFKTDQTLWYNNGVWGQMGFAVPNFGLGAMTLNQGIQSLVKVMGRNLSGIMISNPDVNVATPPSINSLTKITKLINRARQIMGGRAVPPGTPNIEVAHVAPGAMDQIIFPVPYFTVRNSWLKEYCGWILTAIAEACQHSENAQPLEISTTFAGLVGQCLQRVYTLMATELLQIDPATANTAGFVITPAMLGAYNPGLWFSSTELIDVTPSVASIPTDVDVSVLTNGIPASQLVGLALYPSGTPYNPSAPSAVTATGTSTASSSASGTAAGAAGAVPAFAPAPGP